MNIPIFKYYDAFQMFQRISCASNEDMVSIKEKLADRAKRYTKEIAPEMKNIAKLKRVMDDYIDGELPSIKIVLLEDFSNELGNILSLYEPEEVEEEIIEKPMKPRIVTQREMPIERREPERVTLRSIEEETEGNRIRYTQESEKLEEEYEEDDYNEEDTEELGSQESIDARREVEKEEDDTRPQFLKSIEKYYNRKNWDDDSEE